MTGTVITKKHKSGRTYLYVKLSYKEPGTGKWQQKVVGTGLEERGNRRKAAEKVPEMIQKYAYLENPYHILTETDRDITLCRYAELWLEGKKPDLEITTFEEYRIRIDKIKAYFSATDPKLVDVTPHDLDVFMKYLRNYGKVNQKTREREPMAVRSVRSVRSILSSIYSQAIIDGLVVYNPVLPVVVHGKKNRDYEEKLLFLTESECKDFLSFLALPENKLFHRLVPMAFFGIYYGLRRSEMLGLKWDAVLSEKRLIRIQHTVVRVRETIAKDRTKTVNGFRDLALFDTAVECLKKLKAEQEENRQFFGDAYQNDAGYVFTWEDGRSYDPNYISRTFKKASKKFGRPEITFHKLRHTCASLLIGKGWDIKKVQYWLGQAEPTITLRIYAHYDRQHMNEAPDDLDDMTEGLDQLF
ncbi:MAG: site-specific integrase [Lachnospiraceae bacterium]|nr:site-specific integrase [Lachnospiraceae bacterium]